MFWGMEAEGAVRILFDRFDPSRAVIVDKIDGEEVFVQGNIARVVPR